MPDARAPRPAHFQFSMMLLFVRPWPLHSFLTVDMDMKKQHKNKMWEGHKGNLSAMFQHLSNIKNSGVWIICLVLKTPCTLRGVMSHEPRFGLIKQLERISQILGSQSWIHVRRSLLSRSQTASSLDDSSERSRHFDTSGTMESPEGNLDRNSWF